MLVSAALIGACGASPASPTVGPGRSGSDALATQGGAATPGALSTLRVAATPAGSPGPVSPTETAPPPSVALPSSFSPPSPEPTWPPVGGLVRVVNLYQPIVEPPFALDVRQRTVVTPPEPIVVVRPGSASPYFDPGDAGGGSTDLALFKTGSTAFADQLIAQGWTTMKDRQISIVVVNRGSGTSSPTASASPAVRAVAADYVVEERGGEVPRPSPGPGKGILWIDTQALNELPAGTGLTAAAVGTGDGTCLSALGDQPGRGFTFLFGQQAFAFSPGPVKLNVYSPVANPDECTGKPVFGPIAATIAAGREQVVILYGPDMGGLKTLRLPVGL